MKQLFSILLASWTCACTAYTPAPLPEASKLVTRPEPDLHSLKVAAESLSHPVLKPVTIDLKDGLSPGEAATLAVLANPDLKAVRDAHGELAAQLLLAGLLPNPVFSGGVDVPFGKGSDGTELAANLGLEFELSSLWQRAAKVAEASAELSAVDLGIAWKEWQLAQAAKLATVRLFFLSKRLEVVKDELAFESETLRSVEQGLASGDATLQDLGIHRSALETIRGLRGELERAMGDTHSQLNLLLGLPPAYAVVVKGPKEDFAKLPPGDRLIKHAVNVRLDLEALRRGYRAGEARLRQAVVSQFPSLSIGFLGQKNEAALKFLGGFISLELPFLDHAQGRILLAKASRKRLRHEYEARIEHVRAEVARLITKDAMLAMQIEKARLGEKALASVESREQKGVLSGDVDRLAWQDVRLSLFDIRLRLTSLSQARAETRIALETELGAYPNSTVGNTADAEGKKVFSKEGRRESW